MIHILFIAFLFSLPIGMFLFSCWQIIRDRGEIIYSTYSAYDIGDLFKCHDNENQEP